LLGLLAALLVHGAKPAAEPKPRAVAVGPQPAAETAALPPVPGSAPPEPFRWNQLYARDYHVYVKNLRAIGCPEATLRAIVAADVHVVFQQRAEELGKKLTDLANSSWSSQLGSWNSQEAWKLELRRLPDEETTVLADYLGEKMAAVSPAPSQENQPEAEQPAIEIPLAVQPVDFTALNLDEGQMQAITNLQHRFLGEIGGPGQDPHDPAYQARWRTAQAEVDNLLQGMIGNHAYQEYQLQVFANNQAQSAQNAASADSPGAAATGN
jgi:hypothetical protein